MATFKAGEEVIIARGKYRNQTAIVVEVGPLGQNYAVKLGDGNLVVINAVNVRLPHEVSISASDLAEVFNAYVPDDLIMSLLKGLESKAPGITSRVRTEAE